MIGARATLVAGISSLAAAAAQGQPAPACAPPVAAQGVRVLGGPEIAQRLTGNTLTWTDGVVYREVYRSDSTIAGTEGREAYEGTWAVEGDCLCVRFADEPRACYGLGAPDGATAGGTLMFYDESGALEGPVALVPGNPFGL